MRRALSVTALAGCVAAATGLVAVPPASASPKSSEVESSGTCTGLASGSSTFESEVKLRPRRDQVRFEFDVETAVAGQEWTFAISDASGVLYTNTRMSWLDDSDDDSADDSSSSTSRLVRDRDGADDDSDDSDDVSGIDDSIDDSDDDSSSDSVDEVDDSTDESDDESDDLLGSPSASPSGQVEWQVALADNGVRVFTLTATNAATAEICSVNVTL